MVDWPDDLPQSTLRGTYSETRRDGRRKAPFDTGPGKMWRRTSAVSSPFTLQFIMTDTELVQFADFFETTTAEGSLPFNMPAPRGGGTWLCVFSPEAQPYTITDVAPGFFRVSLNLERLP